MNKMLEVKEFLKDHGIAQADFADMIGVHRTYVSRMLNGINRPTAKNQEKIEKVMQKLRAELPPPNDTQSYIKAIKEHMQKEKTITPAMLKEISDVQHGRKPHFDYTKFAAKPLEQIDSKYFWAIDLFFETLDKCACEDNRDVFNEFGKAVYLQMKD